jgi:hypothetical protein
MPEITISLDEELLKPGRRYAGKHQMSLNTLIRKLLDQTISMESTTWLDECFDLMDRAGGDSKGRQWRRKDLYNDLL